MVYRYCMVPECKSTTVATPSKTFISVPLDKKKREIWLKAARKDPKDISEKSNIWICEDHFNLEKDLENFMEWKLMGVQKRIKKDVVPHIFACQSDRKRTADLPVCDVVLKRARQEIQNVLLDQPSTSKCDLVQEEIIKQALGVQVNLKKEIGKSPNKANLSKFIRKTYSSSESGTSATVLEEISKFEVDSDSVDSTNSEFETVLAKEQCEKLNLKHTIQKIQSNPRLYLGVMKEVLYIIGLIQELTQLDSTNIYLTLQKIRLDKTFAELGDDFGLSEISARRIFSTSVGAIAQALKDLISWSPVAAVRENLPIPFRACYNKVYAIIDCLEIEIQKPEDPIKQALTWSKYRKANTIKYLVSSTPDGLINFISHGFGGRTSDTVILKNSGFLNKLEPNMHIMADRDFKHIDRILKENQCVLVRTPSVQNDQKLSQLEALETKKISSLRIHIETVIRQLREFKMLRPHACTHIKLVPYLDSIINIAGGLVNIHSPLIKWEVGCIA